MNEQRLQDALHDAWTLGILGHLPLPRTLGEWREMLDEIEALESEPKMHLHVDRVPTSVDVEACERVVDDGNGAGE